MAELPADVVDALRDEYALERELGRGGMATVFLARDLKHKRPVALKLLHPELGSSLGPQRFRFEIETAARLHHPHICAVYDSGEIYPGAGEGPPRLWFTMPFVRGESLRERLRREAKLPIEEALRITRAAAAALQYAHDEGVVLRDIKPENILLSHHGATLVADFGVARPMDPLEEQRLTQAGRAVGTPAYMAPEQALAERTVDARADQYALAATCYEMLAGAPPFTSPTAAAIIATRFREPTPSVRASRPGGRADWALALAETHWLRGEHSRARAYGNTAVTEFATLLYEWGDRAGRGQIMALRAMSPAYAGRTAEAIAEGERANQVQPPAERVAGPYSRYLLARIYLLAGEPEKAMDRIEAMLKVPDLFSPAWIRIDPTLAGLRRSARYREVLGTEQ